MNEIIIGDGQQEGYFYAIEKTLRLALLTPAGKPSKKTPDVIYVISSNHENANELANDVKACLAKINYPAFPDSLRSDPDYFGRMSMRPREYSDRFTRKLWKYWGAVSTGSLRVHNGYILLPDSRFIHPKYMDTYLAICKDIFAKAGNFNLNVVGYFDTRGETFTDKEKKAHDAYLRFAVDNCSQVSLVEGADIPVGMACIIDGAQELDKALLQK